MTILRKVLGVGCAPVALGFAAVLPAAAQASQESEFDEVRYEFRRDDELGHFAVVGGDWHLYDGELVGTPRGGAARLSWRRPLRSPSRVRFGLTGSGRASLVVRGPEGTATIVIEPREGRFELLRDDVRLKRGFFEPTRGPDPLEVALWIEPTRIRLRPGEDDPTVVELERPLVDPEHLTLVAHDTTRFRDLRIGVRSSAELRERDHSALALAIARERLTTGDFDGAFRSIQELVPTGPAQTQELAALPNEVRRVLQALAPNPPRAARELLATLLADRVRVAFDGSTRWTLPLDLSWVGRSPQNRRLEGVLLEGVCPEPFLRAELFRYDRRVEYWFGEEPSPLRLRGGSGRALAEAREADLLVEWEDAEPRSAPMLTEPRPLHSFSLTYRAREPLHWTKVDGAESEAKPGSRWRRDEYYFLCNGHTLRLALEGPEASFTALEADWKALAASLHTSSEPARSP